MSEFDAFNTSLSVEDFMVADEDSLKAMRLAVAGLDVYGNTEIRYSDKYDKFGDIPCLRANLVVDQDTDGSQTYCAELGSTDTELWVTSAMPLPLVERLQRVAKLGVAVTQQASLHSKAEASWLEGIWRSLTAENPTEYDFSDLLDAAPGTLRKDTTAKLLDKRLLSSGTSVDYTSTTYGFVDPGIVGFGSGSSAHLTLKITGATGGIDREYTYSRQSDGRERLSEKKPATIDGTTRVEPFLQDAFPATDELMLGKVHRFTGELLMAQMELGLQ